MSEKPQKFKFRAYTPKERPFKPLVNENISTRMFTKNASIVASELDHEEDEYSEWSGISDAEDISLSPMHQAHSNLLDNDADLMSSPTQYFDAFEDRPSEEPLSDEEDATLNDYIDYDFNIPLPTSAAVPAYEEAVQISKKRGRRVESTFPSPPQGELAHPFDGWVIDKVAMDEYMPNYAKQEGCAMNPLRERGGVIRWRCVHGGKYNDYRHLPVEVTDKRHLGDALKTG